MQKTELIHLIGWKKNTARLIEISLIYKESIQQGHDDLSSFLVSSGFTVAGFEFCTLKGVWDEDPELPCSTIDSILYKFEI